MDTWRRLGTAVVSDAMEALGMRRSVIFNMRCTLPDVVSAGPAFTIRQLVKHGSAAPSDRLVTHAKAVREQARPGQFIVIDAGGFDDLSSWGEQHSRFCLEAGIGGLLMDGCIRDASKIRRMGFPAFCRGFTPLKSQWDYETVAVNEPVMIGRVQVRPGDLIVADEDGVIVVPSSHTPQVLELALSIEKEEKNAYMSAQKDRP
ncbi:MAG: RraA family protein [Burkholderiaceae bacterium]|nr:RraA family protein [Burkholderiaceae bacterium]